MLECAGCSRHLRPLSLAAAFGDAAKEVRCRPLACADSGDEAAVGLPNTVCRFRLRLDTAH